MKNLLIAVLTLSSLSFSLDAFAEQKIVFCSETSSFRGGYAGTRDHYAPQCNEVCSSNYTCNIEGFLANGWKIDANLAKSIQEYPNKNSKNSYWDGVCTCNGTQYVLSKVEKKVEVVPVPDINTELFKKEIELLKKENDMLKKDSGALKQENEALKQENEALKQENEILKKKASKKK